MTSTTTTLTQLETRITVLEDAAERAREVFEGTKTKIAEADYADSFRVESHLTADARRWGVECELHCAKAVLEQIPEASYVEQLERLVKYLIGRSGGYMPNSTSNVWVEIDLRRHYEVLARVRELESALEYYRNLSSFEL